MPNLSRNFLQSLYPGNSGRRFQLVDHGVEPFTRIVLHDARFKIRTQVLYPPVGKLAHVAAAEIKAQPSQAPLYIIGHKAVFLYIFIVPGAKLSRAAR